MNSVAFCARSRSRMCVRRSALRAVRLTLATSWRWCRLQAMPVMRGPGPRSPSKPLRTADGLGAGWPHRPSRVTSSHSGRPPTGDRQTEPTQVRPGGSGTSSHSGRPPTAQYSYTRCPPTVQRWRRAKIVGHLCEVYHFAPLCLVHFPEIRGFATAQCITTFQVMPHRRALVELQGCPLIFEILNFCLLTPSNGSIRHKKRM